MIKGKTQKMKFLFPALAVLPIVLILMSCTDEGDHAPEEELIEQPGIFDEELFTPSGL